MKKRLLPDLSMQYFFVFFIYCVFSLSPSMAMDDEVIRIEARRALPIMKFKLGFEFQESSGLCEWALNNPTLQKKELFSFKAEEESTSAWHVVIDTSDIEFVTRPFSYEEDRSLGACISTITRSFEILRELLIGPDQVTFLVWMNRLRDHFRNCFEESPLFVSIRDRTIARQSVEWNPKFSPQATIQHPLEYSIPLYFGLFGFSSRYMPDFSASLPCRDLFLDAQKAAIKDNFDGFVKAYHQKMNGLVFLHALTLNQMTPDENQTDTQLLEETYAHLTQFYQIDPKIKLTLMSRRPFSEMLKGIHSSGDYSVYFKKVMNLNSGFFQVPHQFGRTNYAEQFFDSETGAPKPLLGFLPLFREEFRARNEDILTRLLQQGVISTTMIRNLREDMQVDDSPSGKALLGNYFEMALKSVENSENRYIIDPASCTVRDIPFRYDYLSPPWFLDAENSMGRLKEEMSEIEKSYGEAIVEVRGIRDVQRWFLEKCQLSPELAGSFLTRPNEELREQALRLFNFLYNFGTPTDVTEIFYLGIPSALRY